MKKIGILFGQEDTFPNAFIERVNSKNIKGITAEAVRIDVVQQNAPLDYAVIIDRISQDVPFYRAALKNAAMTGTAVINNPFWWSADEKFFNNCLAEKIGVPVPKTVLLPSHHRPDDTSEKSFRNLVFPTDWEYIFDYIGFPAYMKPYSGGGWKNVYKINDPGHLFSTHAETGQLVMMLQEEIVFDHYFRNYCLGGDRVLVMPYEPRNPHHLRYKVDNPCTDKKILKKVEELTIKLNQALGYDFNTVEFAVRDGIPYAIDFCNPAPDADRHSVGEENFEWIVENAANFAIEKAQQHKEGKMNLTWGEFMSDSVQTKPVKRVVRKLRKVTKKTEAKPVAKKAASKKVAAKKASPKKSTAKKATATKTKTAAKKAAPKKRATATAKKK